jgi:cystathionine beta-lyase/cystathionine gamma-synthase
MNGPGCVLAFELHPGIDADRMLQSLRLITPAVSLGSVDTLIQRPAALTHRVVDPKARAASGVSEGLLRLSVGIEDAEDLWADLKQAIEASGHGMARAA